MQGGFAAVRYLRAKADAELDFRTTKPALAAVGIPKDTPHPVLYARLKKWRDDKAEMFNLELYEVLPTRSLLEIVQLLPLDLNLLRKVKGVGTVKIKQFGAELISLVQTYCSEFNIPTDHLNALAAAALAEKPPKTETKMLSFELLKTGKTIDEIAAERGFVRATIEGHLAHFIGLGELDIFTLMERKQVEEIETYFREQNTPISSVAKAHFEDRYSYGQLNMVLEYMRTADGLTD